MNAISRRDFVITSALILAPLLLISACAMSLTAPSSGLRTGFVQQEASPAGSIVINRPHLSKPQP